MRRSDYRFGRLERDLDVALRGIEPCIMCDTVPRLLTRRETVIVNLASTIAGETVAKRETLFKGMTDIVEISSSCAVNSLHMAGLHRDTSKSSSVALVFSA